MPKISFRSIQPELHRQHFEPVVQKGMVIEKERERIFLKEPTVAKITVILKESRIQILDFTVQAFVVDFKNQPIPIGRFGQRHGFPIGQAEIQALHIIDRTAGGTGDGGKAENQRNQVRRNTLRYSN